MTYNPIFEEEVERQEELRGLQDSIKRRLVMSQFKDFFTKVVSFGRKHPITAFAAVAGLLGLGIGYNRK